MIDSSLIHTKAKILKSCYLAQEGHIASSFSILNILDVLVKDFLFKYRKYLNNFILSKGHAAIGYYAILNKYKYISDNELFTFSSYDSYLGGHPKLNLKYFISASTGSLGHGLPIAVGKSYANKNKNFYCLIGDQECNEGTIWESLLVCSHHKLKNLTIIIDRNFSREEALSLKKLKKKLEPFCENIFEIDGHNYKKINKALKVKTKSFKIIIANTIKGNGIKIMENNNEWHHKFPQTQEELKFLIKHIKY